MDEDMEDTVDEGFVAVEIDIDYEFDAARYFDFSRDESPLETKEADGWFETAGSYPPSPFIVRLNLREDIMGNVHASPKCEHVENTVSIISDLDSGTGQEYSELDENKRGLTFYDHTMHDVPMVKTKASTKASRSSTLMKPTASHLAKQNRPRGVLYAGRFLERFQKPFTRINEKSLENLIKTETQAAKRQKLEGGHFHKIADPKPHFNLVHKVPKKSGTVDGNSTLAKLKLTIPREPDLETAQRAQRSKLKNHVELREDLKPTSRTFRARPLNRKILEAPSFPLPQKRMPRLPEFQVFHLKTSERALQHSHAASSVSLPCKKSDKVLHKSNTTSATSNDTDSKRPISVEAPNKEGYETTYKFKARPLNKKILSSKGDIGVFRNSKQEATVPMEFNFPTDKRFQHKPPIELFNKLSLKSEIQPNTASEPKLPRATPHTKGSKENSLGSFQRLHGMMHEVKEKPNQSELGNIHPKNDGRISAIGSRVNSSRRLGIR